MSRFKHFNATLHQKRQDLIDRIKEDYEYITEEFYEYDKILEDSFVAGIPAGAPRYPEEENIKWTHLKAVFFSSTVLTTIGKFKKTIDEEIKKLYKLSFDFDHMIAVFSRCKDVYNV